jgi:serine/threonine protein kinase
MVKMGMHRKTGRRVAIKILNKIEMKEKELDQVRTEIEIMKICQHPNIIKLYDVFENPEYMYISN